MKFLKQNWKALIALLLLIATGVVYFKVYTPAKEAYERKVSELNMMITALQTTIAENLRYVEIQDELPPANEAIENSRLELYKKFPTELKEEDQLMYVLYLEEVFGTEIYFNFGAVTPVAALSDGSMLNILSLTVNYKTTYDGFKEMIDYLASDSRITSVQTASMEYDAASDTAIGALTLSCYIMDSELLQYQAPDVTTPAVGKENIYD
jgi:hypothetical protein